MVGRGLDPAVPGCLMVTFLGKVAAPGPALPDLVPSLAVSPSFLTGQKGSEKAAANSEARGTAKGACGPLWKPRGSDVVARDGLPFSQGKGSLLQYPFFPAGTAHPGSRSETPPAFAGGPVRGRRLLCPCTGRCRSVCRGRIYAARQGFAVTRGSRLVARFRRSVGRAFTPAEPIFF